jgi:hypothetical protein
MSDPAPNTPPPQSPRRHPAITALMVLIGIVLLLPGMCALLIVGLVPGHIAHEEQMLLAGCLIAAAAGIFLIVRAARGPRG